MKWAKKNHIHFTSYIDFSGQCNSNQKLCHVTMRIDAIKFWRIHFPIQYSLLFTNSLSVLFDFCLLYKFHFWFFVFEHHTDVMKWTLMRKLIDYKSEQNVPLHKHQHKHGIIFVWYIYRIYTPLRVQYDATENGRTKLKVIDVFASVLTLSCRCLCCACGYIVIANTIIVSFVTWSSVNCLKSFNFQTLYSGRASVNTICRSWYRSTSI